MQTSSPRTKTKRKRRLQDERWSNNKNSITRESYIEITMKDVAYKILWSTIEDFVGLWEILWELNSVLPENSQKKNQNISKKILRYFLEQNQPVLQTSPFRHCAIAKGRLHNLTGK